MRLANHLWDRFGRLGLDDISEPARTVAGQCVLDWFGCALVGSREPLSAILRDELGDQAGPCSIVGTELHCAPGVAALLNGAAGHALDFDDTHSMMGGHPTVPVFPAALAQAQEMGASGQRLLVAFIVGVEVESRVGALIGGAAYKKGWHSTSTIGVHGAAAAACHLMGASNEQFAHALGLAASQASGLKANFGTMTKPFHAGHAAERGLLSARLAMRGFTSNPEAVDGRQGYADAAASGHDEVNWQRLEEQDGRFLIEDTLFKYHAACYLTHAGDRVGRTTAAAVDGRGRCGGGTSRRRSSPCIRGCWTFAAFRRRRRGWRRSSAWSRRLRWRCWGSTRRTPGRSSTRRSTTRRSRG